MREHVNEVVEKFQFCAIKNSHRPEQLDVNIGFEKEDQNLGRVEVETSGGMVIRERRVQKRTERREMC